MNPMTLFLIGLDLMLGPSRLRLCDIPRGGDTTSIAAATYCRHGVSVEADAANEGEQS